MLRLHWQLVLANNNLVKFPTLTPLAGTTVQFPMLDENLFALSTRLARAGNLREESIVRFSKTLSPYSPKLDIK